MQSLQGVGVGFVTSEDWPVNRRIFAAVLPVFSDGSALRSWGAPVLRPYNGVSRGLRCPTSAYSLAVE